MKASLKRTVATCMVFLFMAIVGLRFNVSAESFMPKTSYTYMEMPSTRIIQVRLSQSNTNWICFWTYGKDLTYCPWHQYSDGDGNDLDFTIAANVSFSSEKTIKLNSDLGISVKALEIQQAAGVGCGTEFRASFDSSFYSSTTKHIPFRAPSGYYKVVPGFTEHHMMTREYWNDEPYSGSRYWWLPYGGTTIYVITSTNNETWTVSSY